MREKVIDGSTTVQELMINSNKDNLKFILPGGEELFVSSQTALVFRYLQKLNQKSNSEHKANQFRNINIFTL